MIKTYPLFQLEFNRYLKVESRPERLSGEAGGVILREVIERLLDPRDPDLITLDITMPRKSGVKFYREIKEDPALKDIPIIVVTGVTGLGGNPEEFHQYLSTRKNTPPPDGFIPKPVDQQLFLETISRILAED